MAIHFDPSTRGFHLKTGTTSYVMQIAPTGHLLSRHWGGTVSDTDLGRDAMPGRAFSVQTDAAHPDVCLDTQGQEAPAGNGDFRTPAFDIEAENGVRGLDLRHRSHRLFPGKPTLAGQPATYVESPDEAETLEIVLADDATGVEVTLRYTVFSRLGALARSATVVNRGAAPVVLTAAASASLDLPGLGEAHDVVTLDGTWARERSITRSPLRPGVTQVLSRRGTSSHQHNPFLAVCSRHATETTGDVWALNLVYAGNHRMLAEVDAYATVRLMAGVLPETFRWTLAPGGSFDTPECVLVHSAAGFGPLSRAFHRLYRTRLCRGPWRDRERPVLLNNWEGTYFDFNTDRLLALARGAADLGCELFVLDDGWFGARDHDRAGLGDWVVNEKKLPGGLARLASEVNRAGLAFGLWFEPEMVNPDSDLYRAHPDWCLHLPGRGRQEGRNQLILDITRREVRDAIMDQVLAVMTSAPIGFVKWDMNRHADALWSAALPGSRQGEVAHRYTLAVYEMHQRLLDACPGLLLEGCSGGGGRFDPAMLFYCPQIWTSDNSDAVGRMEIQAGTSLAYPWSAISAHVSAVPNHQTFRTTPLETRFAMAAAGPFGLEFDPTQFSDEERARMKTLIAEHKRFRRLVTFGELFRLRDDRWAVAWALVAEDRGEALVTFVNRAVEANPRGLSLRLDGLDPAARYRVTELQHDRAVWEAGGDTLMARGLLPVNRIAWGKHADWTALRWHLERLG